MSPGASLRIDEICHPSMGKLRSRPVLALDDTAAATPPLEAMAIWCTLGYAKTPIKGRGSSVERFGFLAS